MSIAIGVPIKGELTVWFIERLYPLFCRRFSILFPLKPRFTLCFLLRSLLVSYMFSSPFFFRSSVLHEAEGHVVTVESTTGEVYRGKLIEAEDNMNLQVANLSFSKALPLCHICGF